MHIKYHSWIAKQINKSSDTLCLEEIGVETIDDLINYIANICHIHKGIFFKKSFFCVSIDGTLEVDFTKNLKGVNEVSIFPLLSGG